MASDDESKAEREAREEREKKAAKAQELEDQLKKLEESTARQLVERRSDLGSARTAGKTEGAQIFAEGALGRVDENVPDSFTKMVQDRQSQIDEISGDRSIESARRAEVDRLGGVYGGLQQQAGAMDAEAATRAARDQGSLDIQRQLQANLKNMASVSNATGNRLNRGLQMGAHKQALTSTGDLERQLMMDKFGLQERSVAAGTQVANASAQGMDVGLKGLQQAKDSRINQLNTERMRSEDIQAAVRQDTLNRQLTNLSNRNAEIFGARSLEEGRVNQELALISGVKSETLSSMNYVRSNQNQEESLAIQKEQASKPAPQPTVISGGKSVLCIQYWVTGDISEETLQGDFEYTMQHPEIDEDVKLAYYTWSTAFSRKVLNRGLIYHILRPYAVGWANHMSSNVGKRGYGNAIGAFMNWIGVPLHKLAGAVLHLCGYTMEDIQKNDQYISLTDHASTVYKNAQIAVLSRIARRVE